MNLKFWQRKQPPAGPGDPDWEKALVTQVVQDSINDRRSARRWGNTFKLLTFLYLFALLLILRPLDSWKDLGLSEEHTALIEVKGVIAPETQASADKLVTALREAFEDENTKGVILRINSPGGSPVQAGYVNDEIRRLREKHPDTPVYAVVADLCASGGYYIAVAADKIYVDKASLVGSIGVRIDAFGLEEAMENLGIERRLLTAGENKGILDPFSPLPENQREFLQAVLNQLHAQFIDRVREGRGDRLKGGEELFSGLFWSGEQSIELGLADALGSSSYVAREVIGAEKIVEFTKKRDLFARLADRLGAALAEGLLGVTGGAYPMLR
ncbi:MAG: S49 family peptidase [Chromatiaceae bacterium]|jgi:protease-4|nr:S49 family peptidase [Chromatiaceae bacterium]